MLTLESFEEAAAKVKEVTQETKLIYSSYFSDMTGNKVYLKPENMQRTGAYKVRGAYYKISTLSDEERNKGLITASAGNHAQGVAYAAHKYGVKAVIVMPTTTPLIKVERTKSYGAEVILHGDVYDEACAHALALAEEKGYTFIHQFDDPAEVKNGNTLSVEELFAAFSRQEMKKDMKAESAFLQNTPVLLEKMACAERFRKCTVGGFVNEILSRQAQQFAAVTIGLDDGTTYISFRGTDDTIVGWKEDFNLSNGVVPSHRKALEYLETHGTYIQSMLRIGGHSKGGNLAMYTAMQCSDILQEKILSVYDNDGPGFPEGFFSPGRVERVLPKVTRIIPEASVIGMLLSHQKDPLIVASTQKGILQHDAFTWEVMGPSFIEKESLTRRAAASDRSLHKWIDHMDEKQREHLIGELFSVLEATGADTISQIQEGGLKSLAAMVRQLDKLEPQSKAMVQELITGLFGSWLELLPLPELDKKRFLP